MPIERTGKDAFALRLSEDDLALLGNALNHALELEGSEFDTIMGASRKRAQGLLGQIGAALDGAVAGPKAGASSKANRTAPGSRPRKRR